MRSASALSELFRIYRRHNHLAPFNRALKSLGDGPGTVGRVTLWAVRTTGLGHCHNLKIGVESVQVRRACARAPKVG